MSNNVLRTVGVLGLTIAILAAEAFSQATAVSLIGTKNFPILKVSGYAQYYKGTRCGSNGCIEVDGDKTGFQFGAARTTFGGTTAVYDITLSTCCDANGLCTYKMEVGGKSVGNPFTQTKYTEGAIQTVTWSRITINKGDVIQVMSNGSDSHHDAGGLGPNGYHMAHGRWTKVDLKPVGTTSVLTPATVSLASLPTPGSIVRAWDHMGRQVEMTPARGAHVPAAGILIIDTKGSSALFGEMSR